jgi:signal transduction histidine kinase
MLAVKKVAWYGRTMFTVVYRDLSELKRLEQELLRIAEWEQIRIGQDLHDTIGQQLAGMAYLIEVLARNLDREKSAYAGEARELATAANTAHQQLREVVQSLLPLPEREGLEAGLQRLCDFTSLRQGATCRRSVAEPPLGREIDAVAANHLLCIAKEAIANAVRHGNARNIEVSLRRQNDHGLLSIADDGCGFDVQRAQVRGSGLRIMRYRADILGGKLCLRRREDGGGMVVTCTFSLMRGSGPGDPLTAIAGRTAQNDLWSGDANGKKE